MNAIKQFAMLFVRYLGCGTYHLIETFEVPTAEVPVKVKKLKARGDVAEIWYQHGQHGQALKIPVASCEYFFGVRDRHP